MQTSYSENMTVAIEGAPADNGPRGRIPAMYNGEASAEIPFGHGVKQGTEDTEAILPAAESDTIIGIVLHANQYTKGHTGAELGDDGLVPGAMMNVERSGVVWVVVPTGCAAGEGAWCRAVATGAEQLGAWENADDGTDTIDCTKQARFLDTAAVGGLARLEFDFRNAAA